MSKSLKELFSQKASKKITGVSSSLKQLGAKVESADYLKVNKIFRNRVFPHVDFSKPDKWVRFGSAKKYYEDAIKNVFESYPYDGSAKEKIEWHNSSSFFENYVFDNEYPRTTGYVGFPGSSFSSAGSGSYGTPSNNEYILVTGSINKDNIYNASKNRTDNLIFDLSKDGATVEFWLKKDAWLGDSKTKREVIFDLWNQQPKASAAYGRLRIEMDSTSADTVFLISAVSGTSGVKIAPIGTSGSHGAAFTTAKVADSKWHHYAFTFKNVSSNVQAEMYYDGEFVETITTGSNINGVSGSIAWSGYVNKPVVATIGSLVYRTAFNADSIAKIGHGKLSGSIDEFRYWKTLRTAKQIGSNYFGQVGGGANSDDANTSLGLYYKFNEGMSGISTIDDVILDYSGRVANGKYVGFVSGTYQRNTGSAMILSGKAESEFKDPIIYKAHPKVTNYYNTKIDSGSVYDHQNPSSIYNTFPSWVTEEDNYGTLYNLSQIVASYFDNLYLQIRELPKIKNIHYPSGSEQPYPFANYLLQDKGMFLGEIFNDSSLLEDYKDQTEDFNFKEKLTNVKNRIYQNIYNNLEYIYKSKGTEKSIRAMLRSMGLDDDLVKINYYGNNLEFEFKDNFRSSTVKKRILNITTGSSTASIYQDSQKFDDNDTNQNDNALSYLKGGEILKFIPYTLEANVFFPKKFKQGTKFFSDTYFTSSLFGMHTVDTSGMGAHTTTWDKSGFDGTHASAADAIDMSGYQAAGDPSTKFNITIPVAAGGSNTAITIKFDISSAGSPTSAGSDHITIGTAGSSDTDNAALVIKAINGTADSRITYGNGSGDGSSGTGVQGITAAAGTAGTKVTLTMDSAGTVGNVSSAIAHGAGTVNLVDVTDFSGGAAASWIDYANTRVFVSRPTASYLRDSGYARFHLVAGHNSIVNMSSSWFADVYDDRHWNVSVRLRPKNDSVHFSVANMNIYKSHEYEMEFHGATTKLGEVDQEFHLTKTLTYDQATAFLTSSKKIYGGAHRTNFTGSVISRTDNKMTSLRYWFSYLNKEELRSHVKDIKNYGVNHPYKNAILHLTGVSLLDTKGYLNTLSGTYIPKIKTLGLHWNFENVTGSDSAGQFIIKDFSSGSALSETWFQSAPTGNYGPFGEHIDRYYPGLGYSFFPDDNAAVIEDYVYTAKQQLPEVLSSADQIEIRNFDDDIFTRSSRPMSYFAAIEKSPNQIVSDEMLDMFATMVDFNDIVGAPVNKYRQEYKELNKLRELFFQRVRRTTDFDKFLEFYKWVDFTIHRMLQDLIPVSANVSSDIKTILESHILERNKYQHRYPGFKAIKNDPEGTIEVINKYAKSGYLDADVRKHTAIQKWAGISDNVDYVTIFNGGLDGYKSIEHSVDSTTKKLDVNRGVFKSIYRVIDDSNGGTSTEIDTAREKIRKSVLKNVTKQTFEPIIRAGVDVAIRNQNNQHLNKRINYIKQTFPFKNEGTDDYMLIESSQITSTASITTPENPRRQVSPGKQRLAFKASIMRYDKTDGVVGVEDDSLKGDYVAPFTLYTYASTGSLSGSAVDTLFESGHQFTNLHADLIDQTGEVSLQGPFTEKHVGGMAHRHTDLNTNVSGAILDTEDTRAEAWRIRFGNEGNSATAADAIDMDGYQAVGDPSSKFNITIPVAVGGSNTTITIKFDISSASSPTSAGSNHITIGTAGSGDSDNAALVIKAINGETDSRITYGNASGEGSSGTGIQGITASAGSAGTKVTLTIDLGGTSGNISSAIAHGAGTVNLVDVTDFSGGTDAQTAKIYGPAADENAAKAIHKPRVTFFREGRTKRPVNIRNIETTSSVKNGLTVEGNFYKNYEVVQTAGGDINNLWFVHNSGAIAATGTIESIAVSGAVDFEIEDRTYLIDGKTRQKTVIYERFSAPGGPEVNSLGYLDIASRQYSVYNSLNYRNSLVRDVLNRKFLKNHEGKYSGSTEFTRFAGSPGFDAILGASSVVGSFHNTHNNRAWRLQKYDKTKAYKPGSERVTTGAIFNNAFVSTPIPASDRQYSWITKSLNTHFPHNLVSASAADLAAGNTSPALVQDVLGYAPYDGILSSSTKGYYSAIEFVSASTHVAFSSSKLDGWNFGVPKSVIYNNNESNYGIGAGNLAVLGGPGRNILFTDFTNLNHMVYEPISSSTHVLGYESMDIQNVDTGSVAKGHVNYFNKVFLSGAQPQLHIEALHGRKGYGEEVFTTQGAWQRNKPGEIAVLNAILLNRNGPYGYPSWKQIRTGQHPIARYLRRNNIIDVQRNPKTYIDENRNIFKERFNPNFDSYTVPPVAENRRRPLKFTFLTKPDKAKDIDAVEAGDHAYQTSPSLTPVFGDLITLEATYGNNYVYFPQEKLNKQAGVKVDKKSTAYDDLTGMYLYGGLGDQSEISRFVRLDITEKIFPREENEFLSKTYIRKNFLVEYWNRDPSLRRGTGSFRPKAFGKFTWGWDANGIASQNEYSMHTGSMWPLDGPKDFTSASSPEWPAQSDSPTSYPWMIGAGELQWIHNASYGASSMINRNFLGPVYLRPAYEITVDDTYGLSPPGSGHRRILVAGMPNWDVPAGSAMITGRSKEPFPEGTYEQWSEKLRRQGQGFSLIPEFRISEHIDTYLSEVGNFRFLADNEGFLTVTGSSVNNSAQCAFAKEYLHTDFIKQFHIIDEHKETPFVNGNKVQRAEASSLTLKCQALMKFLPYEGFHPAVRTVQLANLFSASYFPSSTGSAIGTDGTSIVSFLPDRLSQYRPIFQPYFSPGILYNSIKAGIAVDYPVFLTDHKFNNTSSLGVIRITGSLMNDTQDMYKGPNNSGEAKNKQYGEWILGRPRVKDNFDMRLPFESLLDPAEAILGKNLTTGEPESSSSISYWPWNGRLTASIRRPPVDPRYKMAMHNFIAESQKLFCEKQVIKSDISDMHPDFGVMSGSTPYSMYVVLKKGHKNMTPYSRHSAFGYPMASGFTTTNAATTNPFIPIPGAEIGGTSPLPKLEALSASYAAFTPPYEDIDFKSGEPLYSGSLVRISFSPKHHDPTLDNARFDLQTILSGAQVIYARNGFIPHGAHSGVSAQAGTSSLDNAMQISASLNLFSVVEDYQKSALQTPAGLIGGAPDLDPDKAGRKWVIEPKWQVPIYNYRGYKEFADGQALAGVSGQEVSQNGLVVTIPTFGTGTMTFGQWHQYGIPGNVDETVGVEIIDVPGAKSLADAVGLRQGWYPLSRIAEKREIREAVVAIPFRLIRGKKMFFRFERDRINRALYTELIADPEEKRKQIREVGKEVVDMVKKMERYVIPPQFDFLTFDGKKDKEEVKPLAMYIFEFKHELTDTDLSDMWQNLVPDLAYDIPDVQESVVRITHPLLTEAIKKAQISASPIGDAPSQDDIKKKLGFIELHQDLRWMVFKVKQKAATNYYRELRNDRGDITLQLEENTRRFNGRTREEHDNAKQFKTKEVVPLYSYNWPYDFFTMIELVKMDATIRLTPQDVEEVKPNALIGGPGAGSANPVQQGPVAAPIGAPQAASPEEAISPSE